jgi:hypothetical protein
LAALALVVDYELVYPTAEAATAAVEQQQASTEAG